MIEYKNPEKGLHLFMEALKLIFGCSNPTRRYYRFLCTMKFVVVTAFHRGKIRCPYLGVPKNTAYEFSA
ncbi:MAG: hypothetical protein ACI828_001532 [Flavobacteriales bacterium]|jgi:hypothetical protein